jgi:hypothetical protein
MAKLTQDIQPKIFNEIIKTRVAEYIDKEVRQMVKKKTDEIITEVLSELKLNVDMFESMETYEAKLIVKAFYNGEKVFQKDGKA